MADSRLRSFAWCVVAVIALALSNPWSMNVCYAQRVATSGPERSREQQRITINVDETPLATVLYSIARQAGLVAGFRTDIIPAARRVTLHLREVVASEAFEQALRGTGLVAHVHVEGDVTISRNPGITVSSGTIAGHVVAATTKQSLRGAKIGLDGAERVTETGEDGSYHLSNVGAGSHTITVKLLGYAKAGRTVLVQENETVTADIALELSATPLDQVVVTGTVIPTELKAVPSAITVITAKQIEERGITKIDQLFRGDVPGLFALNLGSNGSALLDEVTMFSRGATMLSTKSVGGQGDRNDPRTSPIKTYVDGIELADPKYLSQIDPKSIERIEILTGPQASTIYGSNAINGVMQIFTKRGMSNTPQLTLTLLSGWVENNFSAAHTPQHDYDAQLDGIEGRISYNAGGSWNYMGPWTPAKQLTRTGGFGGARVTLPTSAGHVTADMSLRRTLTQSLQHGGSNQTRTNYAETGWWKNVEGYGVAAPATRTLTGQTLGLTLSYAPASWWSHELGFGQDVSDMEGRVLARGYTAPQDTLLSIFESHTGRRSLRYATTGRIPFGTSSTALSQLTLTMGADSWQNLTSSVSALSRTLTGSLDAIYPDISRQPGHNAGGFLQAQFSLKDQFFLTYGLRAEWNPGFGAEAQPNYAPRYGIAYTQELGPLTAKLRGSYGRSTRPPQPDLKAARTIGDLGGYDWFTSNILPYYGGMFDSYLANPDLAPEHRQGGEGGLELYFGTRGSIVVTRYNEMVSGLIDHPIVDSVRSVTVCSTSCPADSYAADGYGYVYQYQYLNVGSIRNQGWELQGGMNVGPLTARGTYSWTKSRTIGVNSKYRAFFDPINYPQYQPGATFQYLPEHTWAFGVTYARGASNIGIDITGTGWATTLRDDFYYQSLISTIRLPQNRLNVSGTAGYASLNAPYALANLVASHRFNRTVEALLQVQNLSDRYINDYNAQNASLGRQIKFGARVRTPE